MNFRKAKTKEDGAVLVEMSLVALVLILVMFGIAEYGLFFGQVNDVADAVKSGDRAGAATASAPVADSVILSAIQSSSSKLGHGISGVVIFKANGPTGHADPTCMTASQAAHSCNFYSLADLGLSADELAARPESQGWPWSTRIPGSDYLGVSVVAQHSFITPLFGTTQTFGDTSVILLEHASNGTASESGFTTGAGTPANYSAIPQVPFDPATVGCPTCDPKNGPL